MNIENYGDVSKLTEKDIINLLHLVKELKKKNEELEEELEEIKEKAEEELKEAKRDPRKCSCGYSSDYVMIHGRCHGCM